MEEKKTSKLFLDYIPAALKLNKETYIEYYVKHPKKGKLVRKKIRLNRIKSKTERKKYGIKMVKEINQRLNRGWNPFIEEEGARSFENIYDIFSVWLKEKARELRPDSMRSYSSFINVLSAFIKTISDKDIYYVVNFNRNKAVKFMDYIYNEKNVSTRTYNGYLGYTKSLFNWMVQKDYIAENPFKSFKKKREEQKKREIIPDAVLQKIIQYLEIHDKRFLAFLMIEYYALLRPKEIFRTKIEDIDIDRQVIYISGEAAKNRRERLSTIPDSLIKYIKALQLEQYDIKDYVFSDRMFPGKVLKRTKYAGRRWILLRKKLNLPKEYQMYSLRDSGIVRMLQAGIPVHEVSKQAGHSSLEMTSKYAIHANKKASDSIKRDFK
jgi:integrase